MLVLVVAIVALVFAAAVLIVSLKQSRTEKDRGWGCCNKCSRTWRVAEHHSTQYNEHEGCFPLCEKCWTELGTPAARLPFYRQLVELWKRQAPEMELELDQKWKQIEVAVLAGK